MLHLRFTSVRGTFFWRFAETSHVFFRISPYFPVQVLLATRTCLTQAGASVSNTFWHPVLSGRGRSETTDFGFIDRLIHGRTDGWMDGRTDGWMDGRKGGWVDGWMHAWMDGCMDGGLDV